MQEVYVSSEAGGIGDASPGISSKDRRWAILQWLSMKLPEAPPNLILEASRDFEAFVVGNVIDQEVSDAAVSSIRKLDPAVGKIVADAVENGGSEPKERVNWAEKI